MLAHNETRIRFEAAVVERLKESGFLEIEIRTECLARIDDGYQDEVINAGWHYWQAGMANSQNQHGDALREAAANVIAAASDTYKKRNGHVGSFEDESGEKCWIVPFDAFEALRSALGIENCPVCDQPLKPDDICAKVLPPDEAKEEMRLSAASIRKWMPETLPANEAGQIHFARLLAESAAEAIERFIASSEGSDNG